jgi:hypothetical protein
MLAIIVAVGVFIAWVMGANMAVVIINTVVFSVAWIIGAIMAKVFGVMGRGLDYVTYDTLFADIKEVLEWFSKLDKKPPDVDERVFTEYQNKASAILGGKE